MAEYSKDISFDKINEKAFGALNSPSPVYFAGMAMLAAFIGWGLFSWIYQAKQGMGVAGINHPVGWGMYITNFVFWIGIAHSGTLISAILFLVRSKFRDAISRATEAMTLVAIITAGLYPLIHLGRVWVFYYILPYPNQRQLYPNFMSPLVLDLLAILTYLTVSALFFYLGLIPDAAAARDKYGKSNGTGYWKTKLFKKISMGWSGSLNQWRHYSRSYLFFAAFATPLVISVHSIVSWDFAASILPGWHSTLFAPYFVAGAIHSGLAMALTLLIPLRKSLGLTELITPKHLEQVAKLMIVTMLIIAYSYVVEPFIEFYSGSKFHIQFTEWRMTGWISWSYYSIIILNVFVPLTFLSKKLRLNLKWLFIASLLVNAGMFLERYFIVVGSTAHDFMPHNWGFYQPSWVEYSITLGTVAFFFFAYLAFTKLLPFIPVADYKDYLLEGKTPEYSEGKKFKKNKKNANKVLYIFQSAPDIIKAAKLINDKGYDIEDTFSPTKLPEIPKILGVSKSPVRFITLAGALAGFISAFLLTLGTAGIYNLVVGGKPPYSLVTYFIVAFEFTVLFGSIANFIGIIWFSKIYKKKISKWYDERFSVDKYGLLLNIEPKDEEKIDEALIIYKPEKISEHQK